MDDLISRQEAIKAFEKALTIAESNGKYVTIASAVGFTGAKQILEGLPSIDAIIRCKDCKWWDKSEDSPFGYCMAMKHGYFSANWEIGIYRRYKGDFYCADAERKES